MFNLSGKQPGKVFRKICNFKEKITRINVGIKMKLKGKIDEKSIWVDL